MDTRPGTRRGVLLCGTAIDQHAFRHRLRRTSGGAHKKHEL